MAAFNFWLARCAAAVTLVVALTMAFGGWQILSGYDRMARVGVVVEGRMTGSYRESRTRGDPILYPMVSYRTQDGRVIVAQTTHDMDRAEIQRDRAVLVRYDPAKPDWVHLASARAGVVPWVMLGLDLGLGALCVFMLVRGARSVPQA